MYHVNIYVNVYKGTTTDTSRFGWIDQLITRNIENGCFKDSHASCKHIALKFTYIINCLFLCANNSTTDSTSIYGESEYVLPPYEKLRAWLCTLTKRQPDKFFRFVRRIMALYCFMFTKRNTYSFILNQLVKINWFVLICPKQTVNWLVKLDMYHSYDIVVISCMFFWY